ncbi:MAG: alanine--tRNA ligase [Rhodospirillaceae bacterium]|jgi:alanyl-tRNA synthetase|nr:alanine--tRNA ligase [Rhodospirillaceae bacterium]
MQTVNDIRQMFLDFFVKNEHTFVPSSSLVPSNDPTLMFTNAGMVQFKDVFTGIEKRDYSRAVTSQKCVRAGGKHNDLDIVGYTERHHTFFEMLGNFSFGDYFKEGAIELAWRLITKEYALSSDRLLITVYHSDDEAFDLWRKISNLPEYKIIRVSTKDNFWAMGDTGPCGPCSEIFYDYGSSIVNCFSESTNIDLDRFVEIWNLVFMQYEQVTPEKRIVLPKPSIDTGMGLERLATIMQGKHDNYDIDLFHNLIVASADASNTAFDGPFRVSHRVIADHLRSMSFLIADGILPSNDGRGYVLRRIMRRAMRHAHLMGCVDPLLWKLVPTLIAQSGQIFPELVRAQTLITETLKFEEYRFKQTLEHGLKLLNEESDKLTAFGRLDGEVAFRLYDTYGFPLDLTQDALRTRSISVDVDGFNMAMSRQRDEARRAWSGSGDVANEAVWFEIREKFGTSEFIGYNNEQTRGKIIALLVDGKLVDRVGTGISVAIIANQTTFYGESGGQIGDTGIITMADKLCINIIDTYKKLGDLIVHMGVVTKGKIAVGDFADFCVNNVRRRGLQAHHSATHLLHAALRRKFGDHVTQKGSLVTPNRLRFDVSYCRGFSIEEIRQIENEVNFQIRNNLLIETRIMTSKDAIDTGAMALFGEKYGDEVRVVFIGEGISNYSTELCCGIHVCRTGDIGFFKLVTESAIAAGVRRLEAVVGSIAENLIAEQSDLLIHISNTLKSNITELPKRIDTIVKERRLLEYEVSDLRRKIIIKEIQTTSNQMISDVVFVGKKLNGMSAKALKELADEIKKQISSGIIVLVSTIDGKISLVVAITNDLIDRFSAIDLVRVGSEVLGNKCGGGHLNMAQSGGLDNGKSEDVIDAIKYYLMKII